MRLKHVFISEYKNLKNFNLSFEGESFIDIFVGKNGSGKSNLLEALIDIFRHLFEQSSPCLFEYKIHYVLNDTEVTVEWRDEKFFINEKRRGAKTFSSIPLPENILIYYSGHNNTVKSLLNRYETSFKTKIRGANVSESRRFIGVGPEYKSLLLSVLLCQQDSCSAKSFVMAKLGIASLGDTLHIELKRPSFAGSRLKELETESIEEFDPRTHYWGADGLTGEFLKRLIECVKGEFQHSNIYDRSKDSYSIDINIKLFQEEFSDIDTPEQFRLFDNLKTLGMLEKMRVPITISNGQVATLDHFSDGQFQSVYIYALTEIFKDKNCITLLDEPDSFLHPEWQSDFLGQVIQISDEAAKTNHILLSSHSASTVAAADEKSLRLFDLDGDQVVIHQVPKSEVIKSLSAGLISFSESEAQLNINNVLKTTTGPVLFVEGITDEIILETAWNKLYPSSECPFAIQNAFDRIFLRNLFSRPELARDNPGRPMFALFDFDEAYDDWNGLNPSKTQDVESDPLKGLAKQLRCQDHIAMLLPVPGNEKIKRQVLDKDGNPWGKGSDSYLSIETLFYREEWLGEWFKEREISGGGKIIEFVGSKVAFAENIIPTLDASDFEIFVTVFELVKSRCIQSQEVA